MLRSLIKTLGHQIVIQCNEMYSSSHSLVIIEHNNNNVVYEKSCHGRVCFLVELVYRHLLGEGGRDSKRGRKGEQEILSRDSKHNYSLGAKGYVIHTGSTPLEESLLQ